MFGKRDILIANTCYVNGIIKKLGLKVPRLCHSGKKNNYMKKNLQEFIIAHKENEIITNFSPTTLSKAF